MLPYSTYQLSTLLYINIKCDTTPARSKRGGEKKFKNDQLDLKYKKEATIEFVFQGEVTHVGNLKILACANLVLGPEEATSNIPIFTTTKVCQFMILSCPAHVCHG